MAAAAAALVKQVQVAAVEDRHDQQVQVAAGDLQDHQVVVADCLVRVPTREQGRPMSQRAMP